MLFQLISVLALSVLNTYAVLSSKSSTTTTSDGDWHIGCNKPDLCGYYLGHAKRTAVKASPDFIPGIEPYLKDHKGIDTRCSLNVDNLVEKFNGSHWVHHYKCDPQNSCHNLMGSGSCAAGDYIYRIPTKTYLWSFFCPDLPNDERTCQFLNTPPPDVQGLPEPLDPISPSSHRSRQTENERSPTRCDPMYTLWRQVWNSVTGGWETFEQCLIKCIDVDGEAVCYIPATNLSQDEDDDQDTDDQEGQEDDAPAKWIVTRCDPAGSNVVQYLHPSQQWVPFYQCKKICKEFSEFTACEEQPGKFIAPNPPPPAHQNRSVRRELPQVATSWTSKCDAPGQSGITSYFNGIEVGKGNCPNNGVCRDSGLGVAVCKVDGRPYLMIQAAQQPRGDLYNPTAPDFHTYDTRCNPHEANEVQRHEAGRWVHHYQCLFKDSCRDVDGHGVCTIGDNLYILPAANDESVKQGEQKTHLRPQTSCNPSNGSEILEFTSEGSWTHHGVCLPPTQCFDFNGEAGFALCAQIDTDSDERWLPWRALSHSGNNGQVTRCKDGRTLEEFNNNTWVPFQTCEHAFTCRHMENSINGGCVAANMSQIMALGGLDVDKPTATSTLQRLPKRNDAPHDLLSTGQELAAQGEILIEEGRDPGSQSQSLPGTFWGDAPYLQRMNSAPPVKNTYPVHRRSSEALIDDSMVIPREGEFVVEEGNKLVFQGRDMIKSVFGDGTDDYIEKIIQRRAKGELLVKDDAHKPSSTRTVNQ